jgi:hypothetical protein
MLGFKAVRNLGILQFSTADQDTLKYISSSTAIKGGFLEVLEVSEAGSVNGLFVVNKGVGVGMERRFDTPGMTGFELRFQNLLVHATVLRLSTGALR